SSADSAEVLNAFRRFGLFSSYSQILRSSPAATRLLSLSAALHRRWPRPPVAASIRFATRSPSHADDLKLAAYAWRDACIAVLSKVTGDSAPVSVTIASSEPRSACC